MALLLQFDPHESPLCCNASSGLYAINAISYAALDIKFINNMTAPIPPFKSLVTFNAAARLGSFSRAADEMSLTQSAVSQQILKLEELLGQSLFFRQGKGVGLTAAGELLYETVREMLLRLSAGLDRIEPYKNKDSMLIACPADFAQGWLIPRLGKLRSVLPKTEVWVITQREVREIDRIDVDLVISRRPIHTADVECSTLLEDYSIAVCGPQLHRNLEKLSYPAVLTAAPLLFMESEPEWGGRLSEPAIKKLLIRRAATIDDSRLLLDACAREQGIAYITHILADQHIMEQKIVALSQIPRAARRRLWLMRTRLAPRSIYANDAYQWLLNEAVNCL
jgi:LysR family glycine cleavage system transcriptional activator